MTFVGDESVDRQILARLREDKHSVIWIAEESPSITDQEVLAKANTTPAILITADKDFGDLVFRLNQAHHGIVFAPTSWGRT